MDTALRFRILQIVDTVLRLRILAQLYTSFRNQDLALLQNKSWGSGYSTPGYNIWVQDIAHLDATFGAFYCRYTVGVQDIARLGNSWGLTYCTPGYYS
jgi:hypothetical protein